MHFSLRIVCLLLLCFSCADSNADMAAVTAATTTAAQSGGGGGGDSESSGGATDEPVVLHASDFIYRIEKLNAISQIKTVEDLRNVKFREFQ